MEKALAETGMTLPQFSVLTMIAAYSGASGAALALLAPQTMSVIVANLEKAKLIERRAHPEHGRIQEILTTALGSDVLDRCGKTSRPSTRRCWRAWRRRKTPWCGAGW